MNATCLDSLSPERTVPKVCPTRAHSGAFPELARGLPSRARRCCGRSDSSAWWSTDRDGRDGHERSAAQMWAVLEDLASEAWCLRARAGHFWAGGAAVWNTEAPPGPIPTLTS